MRCWQLYLLLVASLSTTFRSVRSVELFMGDLTRCRVESPDVLLWIQGRISSANHRSVLRETMGNPKIWPDGMRVLIIFFLGLPSENDGHYQRLLEYEFEMYKDIVQAYFTDTYKSLVYKTITAIEFIAEHCYNLKLIIKMDDDVVFHPTILLEELRLIMMNNTRHLDSIPPATLACSLHEEAEIVRLNAKTKNYWAVDSSVLPGRKNYPPFCAGFFTLMSGDIPRLLQPKIAKNKPFWMEDRYLGVLQEQIETTTIDLYALLDYGYHDLTQENITSMAKGFILAQHLPQNHQKHMLQIFEYLSFESTFPFPTIKFASNVHKKKRIFLPGVYRKVDYDKGLIMHQQKLKARGLNPYRRNVRRVQPLNALQKLAIHSHLGRQKLKYHRRQA